MNRALLAVGLLLGIPLAGAAVAALVGLGVARGLGAGHVGLAAALVTCLPIAGLWSLLGRGPPGLAAALIGWPTLLLLGLPGYFPGEVPGALATGLAVFAAPAGRDASISAAKFANSFADPISAAPEGEAPPPLAERPKADCPSAVSTNGDQVALPYEGTGHSMAIPVQFGDVELPMLFDTGASVSTLGLADLRRIGVSVPSDAPEVKLRTANGERTAQLVLVPRVWVGGLPVDGVTVGVCEECVDDRTSGLLGLNVSSQFLVTVDTVRKEVVFQARDGEGDRLIDVAPWLRVEAQATVYTDGRITVDVTGQSAAPRRITDATVGLACPNDTFVAHLTDIPPHGEATTTVSLPRGTDCPTYRVTLDGAKW